MMKKLPGRLVLQDQLNVRHLSSVFSVFHLLDGRHRRPSEKRRSQIKRAEVASSTSEGLPKYKLNPLNNTSSSNHTKCSIYFVFIFNTIWLTSKWILAESSDSNLHRISQKFIWITIGGDSLPVLCVPNLNLVQIVYFTKYYTKFQCFWFLNQCNFV